MPKQPDYTKSLLKSFWGRAEMLKEAPQESEPDQFIPTGIQEEMIKAIAGVHPYKANPQVVAVITANKIGKTSGLIGGILKNIFWGPENDFFDYPIFRNFPFPKSGRIVGTKENVKVDGAIDAEITKWWPRTKYDRFKDSHPHYKRYEITGKDGQYDFDVMTYNQEPAEFEGPVKGWTLVDEPPPPKLMGPIFSRFYIGGILIMGFTPINCGLLMNWLQDFQAKGVRVNIVTATIWQNSTTRGKPNSQGTKKGLMTDEQIKDYVNTCPTGEEDARLEGKADNKSGKVYPMFSPIIHVRAYDHDSDYLRRANHYMVIDPHRRYYPFMQWWAVTEDEKCICFNEWPTVETFKGKYYDEIRKQVPCRLSLDDFATVIKLLDMEHYGYKIRKRWMDPRFAKATEGDYTSKTEGLVSEFALPPRNLLFELPPCERIAVQRDRIRDMLKVDPHKPVSEFNEPSIFFMPHCKNSIRAFDRHSWLEDTNREGEDETFKEPPDCARIFLGGLGKVAWKDFTPKKQLRFTGKDQQLKSFIGELKSPGLA